MECLDECLQWLGQRGGTAAGGDLFRPRSVRRFLFEEAARVAGNSVGQQSRAEVVRLAERWSRNVDEVKFVDGRGEVSVYFVCECE
jgi:hypothetical protein